MQKYVKASLLLVALLLIVISFLDFTKHTEPTKVFTVNSSSHVISGSEYSNDLELSIAYDEKDSMYTYKSNAISATIYNDNYSKAFEITDISYVSRIKNDRKNYYIYRYILSPVTSGSNMLIEKAKVKLIYKNLKEIDLEIGEVSIVKDSNLQSNELEIVSKLGTVSNDGNELQMNGLVLGFRNKSTNSITVNSINIQSEQVCILNSLATQYVNTDNNIINIEDFGITSQTITSSSCSSETEISIQPDGIIYYFFPLKYNSDILITSFPVLVSYTALGLEKTYLDYDWKYFDLELADANSISRFINWQNL